jgi:hypothetical protein
MDREHGFGRVNGNALECHRTAPCLSFNSQTLAHRDAAGPSTPTSRAYQSFAAMIHLAAAIIHSR